MKPFDNPQSNSTQPTGPRRPKGRIVLNARSRKLSRIYDETSDSQFLLLYKWGQEIESHTCLVGFKHGAAQSQDRNPGSA